MVMTDRTLPTEGHASRVMPPVGPAMDALVAEALGEDTKFPAYYSRDTHGNAMWALMGWRAQHPDWSIEIDFNQPCHPGVWEVCLYDVREGELTPYDASAPTLAEAICRAIILAARGVRG